MWYIATYQPTALFSLKNSAVTSSGGKTNLIPTMYTVKMAIVDAAFRCGDDGAKVFDWIKPIRIKFLPPEKAVVNNSFIKILREPKDKKTGPAFISSVAYREFVYYHGNLSIAFEVKNLTSEQKNCLKNYLYHINYFGKRGSFVQLVKFEEVEEIPPLFTWSLQEECNELPIDVYFQHLDDIGEKAKFNHVNSYSEDKAKIGKDRVLIPVAIPYKAVSSSRSFTCYFRTDQ